MKPSATVLPGFAKLPKNFPARMVQVKNWGNLIVPRHIVRIDVEAGEDRRATHGWQVRYRGTKFFSDTLRNDKTRTPLSALEMAIEYLAGRYAGQSVPLRKSENQSKSEMTGTNGVRIVRKLNQRDIEEVYVEVVHPLRGKSPKRLYVGTANTATQKRLDAVLERGVAMRKCFEMQHIEMRVEQSLHQGKFLRHKG